MKVSTKYGELHITDKHQGKMTGIQSISTSCLLNPICKARHENGVGVCKHCFSCRYQEYRPSLYQTLAENYRILNEHLLTRGEAARCVFNTILGRIEAFGDVATVTCARNYIRIMRSNKLTKFGIWTKNPEIWKEAIELEGGRKPKNASFVLSSLELNQPLDEEEVAEKYPFIDHIFTVYTKEFTCRNNNIKINCGSKNCALCKKCYRQSKTINHISGLLK